jgi:hypothetical protein
MTTKAQRFQLKYYKDCQFILDTRTGLYWGVGLRAHSGEVASTLACLEDGRLSISNLVWCEHPRQRFR